MRGRGLIIFAIVLAAASGVYLAFRSAHAPRESAPQPAAQARSALEARVASGLVEQPQETRATTAPPADATAEKPSEAVSGTSSNEPPAKVAPLPPELADLPPQTVLENMRTTVRQYGAMFGGNPVGTNPEITRALAGENPKQINFLKADGNRVNSKGELVDPWGTPYFFHQLSGTEMEIRSAGPDKKMWTDDDLVIR